MGFTGYFAVVKKHMPKYATVPVSIPNGLHRLFRPSMDRTRRRMAAKFQSRMGFTGYFASLLEKRVIARLKVSIPNGLHRLFRPYAGVTKGVQKMAVSIPNGLHRLFRPHLSSASMSRARCFNPEWASQAISPDQSKTIYKAGYQFQSRMGFTGYF